MSGPNPKSQAHNDHHVKPANDYNNPRKKERRSPDSNEERSISGNTGGSMEKQQ